MTPKTVKEVILSSVVISLGFAAIVVLTERLESARPDLPAGFEDSDLTFDGGRLRGYSLGADGLVADWYWMRTLQYLGSKIVGAGGFAVVHDLKPLNPRLLYPMLDNASTLDPRFLTVYTYGAMVLPDIDAQQAIKLLEKGIEHNPGEWKLYHFLGYIYWQQKDYQKSAEIYNRGSQLSGAPNWMSMMASNMRSQGSSRDTARQIYTQMLNQAQDDETRIFAQARLLGLDSLDEQDVINAGLRSFQTSTGRCPTSWKELLPWLRTARIPGVERLRINKSQEIIDPSDTPYLLEPSDCSVKHDRIHSLVAID
jgi:tetratricopeptide (TPR) repeat protein